MAGLGSVDWPTDPLATERLVLRESERRDRPGFIDLFSSAEVGTHIGGAQPRAELERDMPAIPGRRSGLFVVEAGGEMIGLVTLDRRGSNQRGSGESELGFLFLPHAWGRGYATEACEAALNWFSGEFPGEPVVLTAQVDNSASVRVAVKVGFIETDRFEEHGAEQWFGVWSRPSHRF